MTEPITPLNSDQKLWILLSHLSIFFGLPFIAPLVVFLVKKQDDEVTSAHAKEALNFHISLAIYCVVLMITMIGIFLIPFILVAACILAIVASVKAVNGEFYRYPLTIRFIK